MMLSTLIKKNYKFVLAGVVLLLLFYAFSFAVKEDLFVRHDFDMTVRVQNNIPVRFDQHFSMLSLIGSFEVTLVILVLFVILRRKIFGIFVIGMFCFMHVVELVGKTFLDHPGTPFMFHRYALDFVFPTGYVQPGGSYPSGHAMRTTFLAIIFIDAILKSKINKIAKIVLIGLIVLFCLLMYVSRVSLGEHWSTDVIGGSLLGAAFAFFSLMFL